jgi:hypothetical protein
MRPVADSEIILDESEEPAAVPPTVEVRSVPVVVMDDLSNKGAAAVLRSIQSWTLTGSEAAFRILARNDRRRQAVIWVLPGFTNNNQNGNVFLGTREQVQAANASSGAITAGVFVSGQSLSTNAAGEIYCKPDGTNSLTITVVDEWDRPE